MTYRNVAKVIAQVATPSQSDDPNTTINKSRLLSGGPACWSEELDHDAPSVADRALVLMARSDRLRCHAELAEVLDGQAEGGIGAV
jgi:hypothetical protein